VQLIGARAWKDGEKVDWRVSLITLDAKLCQIGGPADVRDFHAQMSLSQTLGPQTRIDVHAAKPTKAISNKHSPAIVVVDPITEHSPNDVFV
jgi:hypothetical protein